MQDVRCLSHFQHERGTPAREVVGCTDAHVKMLIHAVLRLRAEPVRNIRYARGSLSAPSGACRCSFRLGVGPGDDEHAARLVIEAARSLGMKGSRLARSTTGWRPGVDVAALGSATNSVVARTSSAYRTARRSSSRHRIRQPQPWLPATPAGSRRAAPASRRKFSLAAPARDRARRAPCPRRISIPA